MPSLKDLKNRISSVKSTRKITSAMKMIAASKFRRAQDNVNAARPYASHLQQIFSLLLEGASLEAEGIQLLAPHDKEKTVLLVVVTSSRGLCGAFNSSVVREARRQIAALEAEGKEVKIFCVGKRARDLLRREHGKKILQVVEDIGNKPLPFSFAEGHSQKLVAMFEAGEIDAVHVIFNKFKSALSQVVTTRTLLPIALPQASAEGGDLVLSPLAEAAQPAVFDIFEPSREKMIERILPLNLSVQFYGTLLESIASEHGARMTAMDNATRNAGDMIDKLTLNYNRSRQAAITTELTEIISGAEAL